MSTTPMMAQWQSCKAQAKGALLLFRLGDFYEAFSEDAEVIAKEIGLTLTSRQGIPMCGVPFHTAELYIDKLIAKGFKVAIAEQTENPKEVKGLVKREITRIVTPGTLITSQLLSEKCNNFFASVAQLGSIFGLGLLDLTTGEFRAFELEREQDLLDELYRARPAEVLTSSAFQAAHPLFFKELSYSFPVLVNEREQPSMQRAEEALLLHFQKQELKGQLAAIVAAGWLLLYLKEELSLDLSILSSLQMEPTSHYMAIDRSTMRHLELTDSFSEGQSLFDLVDETLTPMGARLLRHWIKHPLLSCEEIYRRQEAIALFLSSPEPSDRIRAILGKVRDLERLMTRIAARQGGPRDLFALGLSLSHLPALQSALSSLSISDLRIEPFFDCSQKILSALCDPPPLRLGEGDIFRDGYSAELDQLRQIARDSMHWMTRYQASLREETGVKSLKVGYTKAFGYYIEVSRAQGQKIPPTLQRRQTLVNAERFTTEELKKFEHQILSAEERGKALEAHLFEELRHRVAQEAHAIHATAKAIARLDALLSLASSAKKRRWNRPLVDTSALLEIFEGRHPVVEAAIGSSFFISNGASLGPEQQMMVITGPNMAGKSTYIRQIALIAILAQIGSYVPATSARIGLIDKVFSRIGAADDLARGRSTFMVEMAETAYILNNATPRSLVLLDEIGRGTSTYDGIAIAWAVAEFLLTAPDKRAKTLFATHYWELTQLENIFPHALNFHTAVRETPSGIAFLRKIVRGGTDKSYGIHVAQLAGLPDTVIERAKKRLLELETNQPSPRETKPMPPLPSCLVELRQLDPNQLTPLQALQKIAQWHHAL